MPQMPADRCSRVNNPSDDLHFQQVMGAYTVDLGSNFGRESWFSRVTPCPCQTPSIIYKIDSFIRNTKWPMKLFGFLQASNYFHFINITFGKWCKMYEIGKKPHVLFFFAPEQSFRCVMTNRVFLSPVIVFYSI